MKKAMMWAGLLIVALLVWGWADAQDKGKGDNRDDARSGKIDRPGDGNSGQGDDIQPKYPKPPDGSGDKDGKKKPLPPPPPMDLKTAEKLFEKLDKDGNGSLSFNEFFEFVKRLPPPPPPPPPEQFKPKDNPKGGPDEGNKPTDKPEGGQGDGKKPGPGDGKRPPPPPPPRR